MLRYLVDLANVTWSLFRLTPNVKWYHAEERHFLPNMVNHWFFQADRYRQKSPIFLRAWENVRIESSRKRGCNPCYSCEINGLKSIYQIGLRSTIRLDEWSSILRLNVVWRMIFSIVSRMWYMPSTRHRWDGKCYSSDGSHGLCNVQQEDGDEVFVVTFSRVWYRIEKSTTLHGWNECPRYMLLVAKYSHSSTGTVNEGSLCSALVLEHNSLECWRFESKFP